MTAIDADGESSNSIMFELSSEEPGKRSLKKGLLDAGKILIVIASFLVLALPGRDADDPVMEKAAVRIMGEAFMKNNAIRTLRVLADEIGPRLTGSAACHRAAEYCRGVFEKYGLTNVHLESYDVPGWLPGQASAEVLDSSAKSLRIDSLGLSINTPAEGIAAEVVDVGHGTEEDFETMGRAVKGRIVLAGLMSPSNPEKITREWKKIDCAARAGAAACLVISPTKGGLTRTRAAAYGRTSPIPAAAIAYEDGLWLRRRLEDRKGVKIRLFIRNRLLDKAVAENAIAEIPGREKPEQIVILGAHLDSWFLGPGAADDALGVSIVLETARILSRPEFAPKRTIRFILFTGDEQGTLGSFEYVRAHESEMDNVALMVNADMTGSQAPRVLCPYGASPIVEKLQELLPLLRGLGVTGIEPRYPYDSEDLAFIGRGLPALGLYGQDMMDMSWYHSFADTFDKIEVDKLNPNVAAVATIIYDAASRPEPMGRKVSRDEVIRYFEEKKLTKSLKEDGSWTRLGLPEEKSERPH